MEYKKWDAYLKSIIPNWDSLTDSERAVAKQAAIAFRAKFVSGDDYHPDIVMKAINGALQSAFHITWFRLIRAGRRLRYVYLRTASYLIFFKYSGQGDSCLAQYTNPHLSRDTILHARQMIPIYRTDPHFNVIYDTLEKIVVSILEQWNLDGKQ